MDRIGHVLRIFIEALLVLLLMLGCVRLCTGCALVERAAPKERVAEIVRAAELYAKDVSEGRVEGELTEEKLAGYMYSAGIPDPELLIRPGGECRLSNFLLWQCAYSELYFTDVLWPDFTPAELDRAIAAFRNRDRRFGGVKP